MKKQPLFIAITNQKGGVGKSVVTTLLASYFHYQKGKNVLVVDCDPPQLTIFRLRERELKTIAKEKGYQQLVSAQFERIDKKAYPVITALSGNAKEVALDYLEKSDIEFDIVMIDLPGTVNSKGVLQTILNMDYIFVPAVPTRVEMQSTMAFVTTIQDYLNTHEGVPLKAMYIFWNKKDNRIGMDVYTMYMKIMEHLNLNLLSTSLPKSSRFEREFAFEGYKPFFLSTMLTPSPRLLKGSNLEMLVEEVGQIIDLD